MQWDLARLFLSSRIVINVLVKWPSRLIVVGHFTGVSQITVSLVKLSIIEFLVWFSGSPS